LSFVLLPPQRAFVGRASEKLPLKGLLPYTLYLLKNPNAEFSQGEPPIA
jgi:hypothetical protein